MKKDSEWVVSKTESPSANAHPPSTAMAWARDMDTGEPVYILELNSTRTRSNCRCECPSCDLPLVAINADRQEYKIRPHFRHPKGAPKNECLFLSARLAAMELLREHGVLMLPSRRMSAQVVGLSGTTHEAWKEFPKERVQIRSFDFHDKIGAILTLEDGRQLRVLLTGNGLSSSQVDAEDGPIATILLEINDLTVASMSREELRSKLTLIPDNLCWQSHWNDLELKQQAQEDALDIADELMDVAPEDLGILAGVDAKFRRETLLHLEVKKMLQEAMEIMVPPLQVKGQKFAKDGTPVIHQWDRPSEIIPLLSVQLEKSLGHIIPDVIAKVAADRGHSMLIEVTVTNKIDHFRLARIGAAKLPALEIDLSRTGGLISRSHLKECVVFGLETKRWLFHPEIEIQQEIIDADINKSLEAIYLAESYAAEHKRNVLAIPLNEICKDYIDAVIALSNVERSLAIGTSLNSHVEQARKQICLHAEKFVLHGYPEAINNSSLSGNDGIVCRLLSIKNFNVSSNSFDSLEDVIKPIFHSPVYNRSFHSIYLIALKTYQPATIQLNPEWYTNWRNEVVKSINSGKKTYLRDNHLDQFISLLFPEIADGLANGYGTTQYLHKKIAAPVLKAQASKSLSSIDFDQVRLEAEQIKTGDTFFKWYRIWNDRYSLGGNLNLIIDFLCEIGFDEDMARIQIFGWQDASKNNAGFISKRHPTIAYEPDSPIKQETLSVNLYALAKGRDVPRT